MCYPVSTHKNVENYDINTPGTAGGPGGHDRALAVKSHKIARNYFFSRKKIKITPQSFFYIYLLIMPKYWGGNYFAHGRFPEVGQKQKTEKILQGLRVAQTAVTERWP